MEVRYKRLVDNAKAPFQKYKDDYCWDLYATSCEEIAPNIYRYELGMAIEMQRDLEKILFNGSNICVPLDKSYCKLCLHLFPRSSVWETGMVLANTPGVVDEPYRGGIAAIFYLSLIHI